MRGVKEIDFLARLGMHQGREEGGIGVCEVEGKMFDMVADTPKSSHTSGLSECVGCEIDVNAGEDALGDQVAASG